MTLKDSNKSLGEGRDGDKLVAPEGGWGFVIALSVTVTYTCIVVPASVFGIVFGPFLASVGDETNGVSIIYAIFSTVFSFTGLAANHLLKKKTCREVGLIGAVVYFIGSFTSIFVTSTIQLLLSWGVIQGLGYGLMLPAVFTSFNSYFDKRKTVAMSVSQTLVAVGHIIFPSLVKMSINHFGFRGTVALISAFGLNCIPAMLSLYPVQRKRKKKPQLLLKATRAEQGQTKNQYNCSETSPFVNRVDQFNKQNLEASISFTADDTNYHICRIWKFLVKTFDLGLFREWSFVNLVIGLSLAVASDLAFLSLLPLLLLNFGFNTENVTMVITTYFIADLVCRIFLSVLTAVADINNRHLLLLGVLCSVVFRIAFTMNTSLTWITVITAGLGILRCLIQVPMPLVVAEAYPTRFASAFSLFMVVYGLVYLSIGSLISLIKHLTGSLYMVVHFLTLGHLLCAIPWVIELIYLKYIRYILTNN